MVLAANGQVVVYMGDDERGEFLYKFISDGVYAEGGDNDDLLENGALYAARFAAEVEVLEEEPPVRVVTVTRGEEDGRASNLRSDNILTLAPADGGGTLVSYEADMTVTGRLAKFGFGVMKKKAQSLASEFAGNLEARVNEAASGG